MWEQVLSCGSKCYHAESNVIICGCSYQVELMLSCGADVIMWEQVLSCGSKCYHVEQMLSCGANVVMWERMLSCETNVIM